MYSNNETGSVSYQIVTTDFLEDYIPEDSPFLPSFFKSTMLPPPKKRGGEQYSVLVNADNCN